MAHETAENTLTETEDRIVQHAEARVEEAIRFLGKVVNINSGTMNHSGVAEVGRVFEMGFRELGFETRWVPLGHLNRAGHLFAERIGNRGKTLLLIGHLDTVFEKHSSFQRFERNGGIARGPGVEDMKGGDVVMLYALKALRDAGVLDGCGVIAALIGDEEDSGHPASESRRELIEAARRCQVALGFESAGADHKSVTVARRGYTEWQLRVNGKRGHSSRVFSDEFGAGAIYEASRIMHEFFKSLSSEKHLTLGPGIILGGTNVHYEASLSQGRSFGKSNVIPQTVIAAGDLRFMDIQQRERAKTRMIDIVSQSLPATSAEIAFRDSYPAMPPKAGNYDLLDQLDRISRDLGLGRIVAFDPDERGAADISFVADVVEACLDGLGPAGWGGHSPEETIDLETLPIQIKRSAVLIHRLTQGRSANRCE